MAEEDSLILIKKKGIKRRSLIYAALLSSPTLLALGVIAVISLTHKSIEVAPQGVMLSPAKDSYSLILFMVIYIFYHIAFIGLIYRPLLKRHLDKLVTKEIKKIKHLYKHTNK